MIKTVKSYFIVDVLEALTYKLTASEYSNRADAETACRQLIDAYPEARIREQQSIYDLSKPEDVRRYEAHLKRLN